MEIGVPRALGDILAHTPQASLAVRHAGSLVGGTGRSLETKVFLNENCVFSRTLHTSPVPEVIWRWSNRPVSCFPKDNADDEIVHVLVRLWGRASTRCLGRLITVTESG